MNPDVQNQYRYLLKTAPYINALCAPLFEQHGLNYFSYGHIENKNFLSCLLTNPEWYKYFWEKKSVFVIPESKDPATKDYFYFWDEGLPSQAVIDARNIFGMTNGITMVSKRETYVDYFTFTSRRDNNQIGSFYLNNLDVFKSFTRYFLDKVKHLIPGARRNAIPVPNLGDKLVLDINSSLSFSSVKFTLKELDCIKYLIKGLTSREIAELLGLSPRTIEDRIEMIKNKLGCERKSQIITKLEAVSLPSSVYD